MEHEEKRTTASPTWVFLMSVYILVLNYRRTHDQRGTDGLTLAD
jgi:hypothetical protein